MGNNKKQPLVSVIIPTYNRTKKLKKCINSIIKGNYKNLEIIVINDKPHQDIRGVIKSLKCRIKLIQHKEEKFWVFSRNEGAKLATGKLLFFVDDDNILYKDTIAELVDKYMYLESSNAKIGLLGPIMLNRDGSLWFWGSKANWINPYPKPVEKNYLENELIETDTIPNAYMISKKKFLNFGMEDERLLHHEDTDLAQRLKLNGFKNFIYTKAKIVHNHGGIISHITPKRLYIIMKSHIIIEKRYAPTYRYLLFLFVFLPVNTAYYFLYKIPFLLKQSKVEYIKNYIRGVIDGFKE